MAPTTMIRPSPWIAMSRLPMGVETIPLVPKLVSRSPSAAHADEHGPVVMSASTVSAQDCRDIQQEIMVTRSFLFDAPAGHVETSAIAIRPTTDITVRQLRMKHRWPEKRFGTMMQNVQRLHHVSS